MCIYCAGYYHEFCGNPDGELCCCAKLATVNLFGEIKPGKKQFKDGISTGRKRAAILAAIPDGFPCEWAGLGWAGGGIKPIVGCRPGENLATDIHHGPDKCTMNNTDGNLHRICVTCVVGDMRLLTDDLRWVQAQYLVAGMRLFGFSEDLKLKAEYESTIITSIKKVIEPCYQITMRNGDVLTVSHDHQWVASRPGDRHIKWITTEQLTKRYKTVNDNHFSLRRLVEPWKKDLSYDSGWFAGFLDGEGALSGYHLSASQTTDIYNRSTADRMIEQFLLRANGTVHVSHRPPAQNWKPATIARVANLPDILTILGTTRPDRLLQKLPDFMERKSLIANKDNFQEIDTIEYIGEEEVYSIETSAKTYVVEGYLSHNCHNRWHVENDRGYGIRPEDPLAPFVPKKYELHDPTVLATEDDYKASDERWSGKRLPKAPIEVSEFDIPEPVYD